MLRATAMGGSAESYYTNLYREDYYLRLDAEPGLWSGKGSERLGLDGEVDRAHFNALFLGFDPLISGRKLVQNAGQMTPHEPAEEGKKAKEGRKPGWDLTMSAPKSLSALYAMSAEENRAWIRAQVLDAARETVTFMEKATVTRTGKGGKTLEQTELVSALFLHTTARQVGESMPDPQLHVHACVFNIGVSPTERAKDQDRPKTRSIRSEQFFDLQHAGGDLFKTSLGTRIAERYELTQGEHGWEIKGVSRELCEAFSKRSAEVEKVAPRGTPAWEREQAALKTRTRKDPHLNRVEVERSWQETARAHGFTHEKAAALSQTRAPGLSREAEYRATLERAGAELLGERRLFSKAEFLERVTTEAIRSGVRKEKVEAIANTYLTSHATYVGGTRRGGLYVSAELKPDEVRRLKGFMREREERDVSDKRLIAEELKRLSRNHHRVIAVTWGNVEKEALEKKLARPPERFTQHVRESLFGREVAVNTLSRMLTEVQKKPFGEGRHQLADRVDYHVVGRLEVIAAKARIATGQGSRAKRERDQRIIDRADEYRRRYDIDSRTVVVIEGARTKHPKIEKLVREIEARGGRVRFSEEMLPGLRQEVKAKATVQDVASKLTQTKRHEEQAQRGQAAQQHAK